MTDSRKAAQAVSEGLNCLAEILDTLAGNPSVAPNTQAWLSTLRGMHASLLAIASNEVSTSLALPDTTRAELAKVIDLVTDWTTTETPPPSLRPTAASILNAFGLPAAQAH